MAPGTGLDSKNDVQLFGTKKAQRAFEWLPGLDSNQQPRS